MKYELAKKLKKAGLPQSGDGRWLSGEGREPYDHTQDAESVFVPSLSELIEACGDKIAGLIREDTLKEWRALAFVEFLPEGQHFRDGESPEEAVARLWLALNQK